MWWSDYQMVKTKKSVPWKVVVVIRERENGLGVVNGQLYNSVMVKARLSLGVREVLGLSLRIQSPTKWKEDEKE